MKEQAKPFSKLARRIKGFCLALGSSEESRTGKIGPDSLEMMGKEASEAIYKRQAMLGRPWQASPTQIQPPLAVCNQQKQLTY